MYRNSDCSGSGSRRKFSEAINTRPSNAAANHDWYVIGRTAEHCGLVEDAVAAYQLVEQDADPFTSTYQLAQLGLQRLSP